MECTMQVDEDDIQLILNELKAEEQKYENSSILQKELDDISVICFTKNIESIIDKLFHVSVKICDSYSDLASLDICNNKYKEIIDSKTKCYVVQVFVSNVFQSILINTNWIANISIKNSEFNVFKTVHLKNLIPSNVFNIIIPFSKTTDPAVVNTNFFLPSKESYWSSIKVSKVKTDISYHLIPLYEHKTLETKKNCPLFQISKLYTDDIKLKMKQPIFKYRFCCKSDVRHLFETVLKNCIHKLDINHMQLLTNSTDGVSDLHLFVNDSEATISLDTKNNILKISGSYDKLYEIKEFLIANIKEVQQEIRVNPSFLFQLQALRKKLLVEKSEREINFDNVKMLYEEYKNIIAELPV